MAATTDLAGLEDAVRAAFAAALVTGSRDEQVSRANVLFAAATALWNAAWGTDGKVDD